MGQKPLASGRQERPGYRPDRARHLPPACRTGRPTALVEPVVDRPASPAKENAGMLDGLVGNSGRRLPYGRNLRDERNSLRCCGMHVFMIHSLLIMRTPIAYLVGALLLLAGDGLRQPLGRHWTTSGMGGRNSSSCGCGGRHRTTTLPTAMFFTILKRISSPSVASGIAFRARRSRQNLKTQTPKSQIIARPIIRAWFCIPPLIRARPGGIAGARRSDAGHPLGMRHT